MNLGTRPQINDVSLEVSGPDERGFFTCNIAWEDVGDFPPDLSTFHSYDRMRVQAYALRHLANKLEAESRKEIKP